jgi:hypothetical protein
MMGLSSIKAGARMKETTIFGRVGGLHTENSTSAGGAKAAVAQAASWCSDDLISMWIFHTIRRARKSRPAACKRNAACSFKAFAA